MSNDFDPSFLNSILLEGQIPSFGTKQKSNEILLSQTIAKQLNLKLGDNFHMYFVQQPVRVRKFYIAGIYDSGIAEFDKMLVIGDIGHIQKLNKWSDKDAGGLEIQLTSFDSLEEMSQIIYSTIGYNLNASTVIDNNPQLFDWLELQNMNVKVILILCC